MGVRDQPQHQTGRESHRLIINGVIAGRRQAIATTVLAISIRSFQPGPMSGALLLLFGHPGRGKFINGVLSGRVLLAAGPRLVGRFIDFRTVCGFVGHLFFS